MTWNYTYTPQIWPSFLTVLLLLTLYIYVWPRRNEPGARVFAISLLFGLFWAIGSVFEYAAVDVVTKIFWVKFQAVWMLPPTTAVTCFLLEYTWPGRWLTRRNLALLSVVPLIALLLIVTNDLHHWFWVSFSFNGVVNPRLGPAGWIILAYGFALIIPNLIVMVWLIIHSPQHRWPVVAIAVGQIGIRTILLLDKSLVIHTTLPLDILGLAFVDLMFTLALFGFRLFDPISLAREAAVDQMKAGMLVLDANGLVASLNPAAERMLGFSGSRAKGKPLREVLPVYPQDTHISPAGTEIDLCLPNDTGHDYTLNVSPLTDFRGLEVGLLLLLHDVTEQRKAQALLIEQQRSLAMLQEREQLAREMHDTLGQALAAAHLQATSAKIFLVQGDVAQVNACLENLAETTLQAEADMREYLLGAKLMTASNRPFFVTVREYLERFTRQSGLTVELTVPPDLESREPPQAVTVQLLRIIQEALTNARKHARAHCAQVIFALSDPWMSVVITDDGQGFDPAVAARQGGGFGLRSMRERAEVVGGLLRVDSAPGKGTRVMVDLPASGER